MNYLSSKANGIATTLFQVKIVKIWKLDYIKIEIITKNSRMTVKTWTNRKRLVIMVTHMRRWEMR